MLTPQELKRLCIIILTCMQCCMNSFEPKAYLKQDKVILLYYILYIVNIYTDQPQVLKLVTVFNVLAEWCLLVKLAVSCIHSIH